MVLCNHGAPDGEDEATGREAGCRGHHEPGQRSERAQRRCSSPYRGREPRRLLTSRIAECASRITPIEKCGRALRAGDSSSPPVVAVETDLTANLRGGCRGPLGRQRWHSCAAGERAEEKVVYMADGWAGRASPGSGTTAATATASLKDGSRRSKQCGLQAMERQRTRPFAIEYGLGKRCGRVRPWEQASRCRPTYLTRFICTVVEASHRGVAVVVCAETFSVPRPPSRPDASSRGTSHPSPLGVA